MMRIAPEQGQSGRRIGRPVVHHECWAKVTVVLMNRQVVYLDHLAADVRAANGNVIRRAEIIRALIDFLADSGIDLSKTRSESEVKEALRSAVGLAPTPAEE